VPRPKAPLPAGSTAPLGTWPGAPLEPTGNPLLAGFGPASYSDRDDVPDLTIDGLPKIIPLRVARDFGVESKDPDPRGMKVVGGDGTVGGTIVEVWVDRAEALIRYLEVEVKVAQGARRVLLPLNFTKISGSRRVVSVRSIRGDQFADVPATRSPDQVTRLEEDRITAYYGGGTLYALPSRLGPVL
jgi:photosynthetic reaction center H subunit